MLEHEPGTSTAVGRDGGAATRRCGRCGEENAADATFCAACNALLAAYDAPAGAQPANDVAGPLAVAEEGVPPPPDAPAVPPPEPFAAEPVQTLEIEAATEPETEAPSASGPVLPEVIEVASEGPPVAAEHLEPTGTAVLDDRTPASAPIVPVPSPPVESEFGEAPAPEQRPAVVDGERASQNGVVPPPAPASAAAVIAPPAPEVIAPGEAASVRPARPGRLARSSPAAILTAGAVLWLVACGLLGFAEAAGEVGAVGGAGLAVGAVALYVLAVGLIQAILRRGDLL